MQFGMQYGMQYGNRLPDTAPQPAAVAVLLILLAAFASLACDTGVAAADLPDRAPATRPAREPGPVTGNDVYRDVLEFNRRTLSGAYRRVGRRDPRWDDAAVRLLDATAEYFSARATDGFYRPDPPDQKDLVKLGRAAAAVGCDDPLVVYCFAAALQLEGRSAEAEPLVYRAFDGMLAGGYPAYRIGSAARRAEDTARRREGDAASKAVAAKARAAAAEYRIRSLCGPMTDAERRILLDNAGEVLEPMTRREQQRFLEELGKRPDADPWIKDVLDGRFHISLAWDRRGGGLAFEVKEEGWKGFFKELGLARDSLTRAWNRAPQLPEPAVDMITVAMGAGPQLGEQTADWFERATQAQMDYTPAYDHMYWATLPRWGGSHEQILEIGRAALKSGRFDTLVPFEYFAALRTVNDDTDKEWEILKDAKVMGELVRMTDGYAAALKDQPRAYWHKTLGAAVAWKAGRLDKARQVLDALGERADGGAFAALGAKDGDEAIRSVYLATSPLGPAVREAESLAKSGQARDALVKVREVLAQLRGDGKAGGDGGKDGRAAVVLSSRLHPLEDRLKLATGEWVDIQPQRFLDPWDVREGYWRVEETGLVCETDLNKNSRVIRWAGGDLDGNSFELSGHFEFLSPEPKTAENTAAVVLFVPELTQRGFVMMDRPRRSLGYLGFEDRSQVAFADVAAANGFVVRCVNNRITLELNGKAVGEPYDLPPGYQEKVGVGLGAYLGGSVRFTNLRLRKLLQGAGGNGVSKPGAPGAPGGKP